MRDKRDKRDKKPDAESIRIRFRFQVVRADQTPARLRRLSITFMKLM